MKVEIKVISMMFVAVSLLTASATTIEPGSCETLVLDGKGAAATIESGSTVTVTGSAKDSFKLTGGTSLEVKQGATLNLSPAGGYYAASSGVYMDGTWVSASNNTGPSTLYANGGTINAGLTYWNLYDGWYLKWGVIEVANGGLFAMERASGSAGMPSIFLEGSSKLYAHDGGTIRMIGNNTAEKAIIMGQGAPAIQISDSSFVFSRIWIGGSNWYFRKPVNGAKVLFDNATVTTDGQEASLSERGIVLYSNSHQCQNNFVQITGAASDVKMNVWTEGDPASSTSVLANNTIQLDGGKLTGSVKFTFGKDNRFVINGGTSTGSGASGVVAITGGTGNKFIMNGGVKDSCWPNQFSLGGTENAFEILGGKAGSWKGGSMFAFEEGSEKCQLIIGEEGTLQLSVGNANDTVLKFNGSARNCAIVIRNSSNAAASANNLKGLFTDGVLDFSGAHEGCVLSFEGAQPRLGASSVAVPSAPNNIIFGSANASDNGKTMAVKFTLPAAVYRFAPLENTSTKPIKMYPNTQIVIDQGACVLGLEDVTYPLIKDNAGFGGEMNSTLLATLNDNATLPNGTELVYDETTKTLGLHVIPKKLGIIFTFE